MCAYQGVRKIRFSENFAPVLNEGHLVLVNPWIWLVLYKSMTRKVKQIYRVQIFKKAQSKRSKHAIGWLLLHHGILGNMCVWQSFLI